MSTGFIGQSISFPLTAASGRMIQTPVIDADQVSSSLAARWLGRRTAGLIYAVGWQLGAH